MKIRSVIKTHLNDKGCDFRAVRLKRIKRVVLILQQLKIIF